MRAGILELVPDLLGAVGRVDRGDRATGDGDAVEDDRVLGHVRRHEPDDVARAEAAGREAAGEAVDRVGQLGERVAPPARSVDQRDAVGLIGSVPEHVLR